ncbi:GLPGLI family protein [Aquimarina muelleri]|uniref:GLPGLI family protein n=1 Tax=Aquimarina muelleri TaxID=279356 RepID=UPI003F684E20
MTRKIQKLKSFLKNLENSFKQIKSSLDKDTVTSVNLYFQDESRFGQTFIVKSEEIKWELINETKKIGKYNCYKAKYKEIIAWYAPEIPLQFGPVGFGGLPGLIIHLEYGGFVDFSVKSLDLNLKKDIVIKNLRKEN